MFKRMLIVIIFAGAFLSQNRARALEYTFGHLYTVIASNAGSDPQDFDLIIVKDSAKNMTSYLSFKLCNSHNADKTLGSSSTYFFQMPIPDPKDPQNQEARDRNIVLRSGLAYIGYRFVQVIKMVYRNERGIQNTIPVLKTVRREPLILISSVGAIGVLGGASKYVYDANSEANDVKTRSEFLSPLYHLTPALRIVDEPMSSFTERFLDELNVILKYRIMAPL